MKVGQSRTKESPTNACKTQDPPGGVSQNDGGKEGSGPGQFFAYRANHIVVDLGPLQNGWQQRHELDRLRRCYLSK